ncbi:MAG: DUF5518 domain-containing protein [Methanobacteriaceae archaeon]|nr:DUF5518 domain-containing protein [Methanobacteriaceae archaeon]
MIDQKSILMGTVLAVVLVFVLAMFIPLIGGIIALIIAGIVVGYLVNDSFKIGAIHGSIVGLLTGIIYVILIYARYGFSSEITSILIIFSLWTIPVYILIGLGGGIIGSVIKTRQQRNVSPEGDSDEEILVEKDQED